MCVCGVSPCGKKGASFTPEGRAKVALGSSEPGDPTRLDSKLLFCKEVGRYPTHPQNHLCSSPSPANSHPPKTQRRIAFSCCTSIMSRSTSSPQTEALPPCNTDSPAPAPSATPCLCSYHCSSGITQHLSLCVWMISWSSFLQVHPRHCLGWHTFLFCG